MKKWLVGLMAAGLCLSSAWADTVTYTVESKSEVSVTGTAPDGASAEYASTYNTKCQLTKDNSMTLTLKGFEGATITGLTLSMKSNKSGGAGSLSATCGNAAIAAVTDAPFSDASWNGAFTTEYVDVKPSVTETPVTGDIVITIAASANSLYCQSFTIEYEAGEPQFSVTFDKENWFKVALGEASSVTAIPKNGVEPYTFLWSCDKASDVLTGTEATLVIPDTLDEGDYTLNCQVTDDNGDGDVINKQIGFTVAAIPVITGDNFALVSSSDDLQDGARYLVTDVTHAFAMSTEATGSALAPVDVTETDGVITASDESIIWTLVEDSDGNFALQNGEQYVGWSSGNAATMQAASFANKISVAEGVATITAASDTTRNLKYNKSSPRFAYYATAQTDLALFKEVGEAGLSVTFDKGNGFTVDLGTADSITATAKNGTEPYSYVWTSDTPDLNGTGATLAIPATLAEDDYTVQVEVTDAESNKASKQIYFSVVAPFEPHAINIDAGIQNGTVTSDPEGEAVKGTQVKLTATATTEGYALKEMTVTYGETVLTFAASPATFEMPDEAVSVGATFEEVKDYAELPFVAEDTPYTGPWKGATVDGLTSKGIGDDYKDGSAKLDTAGDWVQVKFTGTPGTLSYAIKGNSLSSDKPSKFLVQESATGADDDWTTLATYVTDDNLTGTKTEASHELSSSSQFVRFFYEEKGAGNVGIYDVYISSGGPAVFSVTFDKKDGFEVPFGTADSITATAKNGSGDYSYVWTGDLSGEGATLEIPATLEAKTYTVTVKATDNGAEGVSVEKSISFTVAGPVVKYPITVERVPGGTLSVEGDKTEAEEGETVKVTATADANMKLAEITVKGDTTDLSFTSSPVEFTMPAEAVTVSATFEEFEVPPYYFQFETGKPAANSYKDTDGDVVNTGSTAETVPTVNFTMQRTGRGGDEKDLHVGDYGLRMGPTNSVPAYFYNTEAFPEDLTAISFQYGIYGTDSCNAFSVSTSSDGETWDVLADLTSDAATGALKTYTGDLPAGTRFIRFDANTESKSNNRRINIDEIQLFTGEAKPKITVEGEKTVIMSGGEASFALQFSLSGYDGSYEWVLTSGEGSIDRTSGAYTWTATAPGTNSITVAAMSGDDPVATKVEILKAIDMTPPPGPGEATLTCEPSSVTMAKGESFVVTLTLDGAELDGGWIYFEGYEGVYAEESLAEIDLADLELAEGTYTLVALAVDSGMNELARTELPVTVTGEGPQPGEQPVITGIHVDAAAGEVTVTFTGDGVALQGTDDLVAGTWEDVSGATIGNKTAKGPMDKPYLRIRQ